MSDSLTRKIVALAAMLRTAFANAVPGLIAALLFYWTPSVQTPDPRQAAHAERSETISSGVAPKAGSVGHAVVDRPGASEFPSR